jgi:glutamyl-Q tRNA(Asp) synthetase
VDGEWLLRIEDIDPPREVPGATAKILHALERLGLFWDGEVIYQNHNLERYRDALNALERQGMLYSCVCSRRDLTTQGKRGPFGWIYPGTCRRRGVKSTDSVALRVRTHQRPIEFRDLLQGIRSQVVESEVGDFVIRRADGLVAYQLAVVLDDADRGITEVVRGSDLLDSTPRQIHLQHLLGLPTPDYLHLPLAVNAQGEKLSKQTGARPLDLKHPGREIFAALSFLNHAPPRELTNAPPGELLEWAVNTWSIDRLPTNRLIRWPNAE